MNDLQQQDNSNNDVGVEKKGPFNQPWFREAYNAAVQFYEKDDVLDSNDRLALSNAYKTIARSQTIGGWLGFSTVFCTPFAYQYYKTNAIKGVKVPRNFGMGLLALFGSTIIAGQKAYQRQLQLLDPSGELTNKGNYGDNDNAFSTDQFLMEENNDNVTTKSPTQRQYEMMALIKNGSAPKWASYFYLTHLHPERRLPNPKTKLEEISTNGFKKTSYMNQRDPIGLYTDPNKEKPKMVVESPPNKSVDRTFNSWSTIGKENNTRSSWDIIRQGERNNGDFEEKDSDLEIFSSGSSLLATHQNSDPIISAAASQDEFDKLLEKEKNAD